MPFDAFSNKFYNIVPDAELPKTISCGRFGTACRKCTCTICGGSGVEIISKEPLRAVQCKCDIIAFNIYKLEQSGLGSNARKYSLDSFTAETDEEKIVKRAAQAFIANGYKRGRSFYISGIPGSGKSHICVAISRQLIMLGLSYHYFDWIKDSRKLKALVTDADAYDALIAPALNADILYIDDFMKAQPNQADIKLAMELIGTRYNAGKPCIISSERSLEDILKFDEAVAGRIIEMCGKYILYSPNIDHRQNK